MTNVGNILSTTGDIMSTVGGYLEYCGDIMMHVGDIMSTVEGVQYRGGKFLLLFEYPTVLMISPIVLKFQRMLSPHNAEHHHGTHDIPPRAS